MHENYYAMIMAGGGGTRLWPLSRRKRPKQMLSLFDERTLFQTSVQRLYGVFPPERILVVTVKELAEELRLQTPEIPAENFLPEPEGRGTAAAIGLASVAIQHLCSDGIMAVLASDHFIGNEALFRDLLVASYEAANDDFLVTMGIEPTFPSTGFGYIQSGEALGDYCKRTIYRVKRFTEKPDKEMALAMLASGDHFWNSGMFIWKVERIMQEFHSLMPSLAKGLTTVAQAWGTPAQPTTLTEIWAGLKIETIDYGVMEHAENVVVLPAAGLDWNDVGSWESLFEVLDQDEEGNVIMGCTSHLGLDTHHTLIYTEEQRRLTVTIGVEDLIVVDTGDVLLVCRRDQAQRVRAVVNELKEKGQIYL
jgi:mannose-1-phosphate guanylyltransferase